MVLQQKEVGNVYLGFQANTLPLKAITFRDDVFGLYAYQGNPVTVTTAVRDAFMNGALSEIQDESWGQGMQIIYGKISWNETQNANGYYITDLVVGLVARVTRDFNTGPNYLINSANKIGWFNQFTKNMSMPWKAWNLEQQTRNEIPYHVLRETMNSPVLDFYVPILRPVPDLPSIEPVKAGISSDDTVAKVIGEFTRQMIDNGITPTVLAYKVDVALQRTPDGLQPWQPWNHGYQVTFFVRVSIFFTANPDFTTLSQTGKLFVVPLAVWIILAIGAAIALVVVVNNMTHTRSEYTKWDVLRDKDGNPILDQNGNPIIVPTESGSKEGPPDWWSGIIQNVVIAGLIIGGIIIAVKVIPMLTKKSNNNRTPLRDKQGRILW